MPRITHTIRRGGGSGGGGSGTDVAWSGALGYVGHSSQTNKHIDWTNASQNLVTTGDLTTGDKVVHQGDTDTYIQFLDDNIRLYAGGASHLEIDENGTDVVLGNPDGDVDGDNRDIDFKWIDNLEGGPTLFHIDTGTHTLAIGKDVNTDYKLDVNGSLYSTTISSTKVSSGTVIATACTIYGNTISGLVDPIYPSAAANKNYVDNMALSGLSDINAWNSATWDNSGIVWDNSLQKWKPRASGGGSVDLDGLTDTNLSTPRSGQTLIYKQNDAKWENELPPITYSQSNIQISANQNINLARFECPAGLKAYIWQASCCGSGGAAISGMWIEMLAGTSTTLTGADSVYKTSSQIIQQGYPLGVTNAAEHVEIRFMYSGANTGLAGTGLQYGNAMMQVSIMS